MTLMLLDSASLYFRAYYGVPESVTTDDGMPVNAIRGFVDMVAMVVTRYGPDRLVACMDADWRPAFRVEAIGSYKAHRVAPQGGEEVPDTLAPQVPVLEQVLDAVGIARVGIAECEADDVIGTLSHSDGGPVDVVTGDRDLFQLVDDARPVRILYTARGVRNLEIVDEATVTKKYGIPGRSYADFAALRGDPSDGLPGVAGVGAKTAAALVSRFGGIDAIVAAVRADDDTGFPAGSRKKLAAALDYLAVAPTVTAVRHDADVPDHDDALPRQPRDAEALVALADRYNLDSPVNRLLHALAG